MMPLSLNDIRKKIGYFCPISNPTVFAKTELLKHFNYNEKLRVGEDYSLWITLIKHKKILLNMEEPTIYYRRGTDFLNRRRGIKYASSDFYNKISTISVAPFWQKIIIFFFAILSFFVRLLPKKLFNFIRNLKHND